MDLPDQPRKRPSPFPSDDDRSPKKPRGDVFASPYGMRLQVEKAHRENDVPIVGFRNVTDADIFGGNGFAFGVLGRDESEGSGGLLASSSVSVFSQQSVSDNGEDFEDGFGGVPAGAQGFEAAAPPALPAGAPGSDDLDDEGTEHRTAGPRKSADPSRRCMGSFFYNNDCKEIRRFNELCEPCSRLFDSDNLDGGFLRPDNAAIVRNFVPPPRVRGSSAASRPPKPRRFTFLPSERDRNCGFQVWASEDGSVRLWVFPRGTASYRCEMLSTALPEDSETTFEPLSTHAVLKKDKRNHRFKLDDRERDMILAADAIGRSEQAPAAGAAEVAGFAPHRMLVEVSAPPSWRVPVLGGTASCPPARAAAMPAPGPSLTMPQVAVAAASDGSRSLSSRRERDGLVLLVRPPTLLSQPPDSPLMEPESAGDALLRQLVDIGSSAEVRGFRRNRPETHGPAAARFEEAVALLDQAAGSRARWGRAYMRERLVASMAEASGTSWQAHRASLFELLYRAVQYENNVASPINPALALQLEDLCLLVVPSPESIDFFRVALQRTYTLRRHMDAFDEADHELRDLIRRLQGLAESHRNAGVLDADGVEYLLQRSVAVENLIHLHVFLRSPPQVTSPWLADLQHSYQELDQRLPPEKKLRNLAQTFLSWGMVMSELGFHTRAELQLRRVLDMLDPRTTDFTTALVHLANAYLRAGQLDRAAALAQSAVDRLVDSGASRTDKMVTSALALKRAAEAEKERMRSSPQESLRGLVCQWPGCQSLSLEGLSQCSSCGYQYCSECIKSHTHDCDSYQDAPSAAGLDPFCGAGEGSDPFPY